MIGQFVCWRLKVARIVSLFGLGRAIKRDFLSAGVSLDKPRCGS
jgi:hypothetical protein